MYLVDDNGTYRTRISTGSRLVDIHIYIYISSCAVYE
jgi:hypothetical protein